MNRSGRLILSAVALFLIASCSAKKEALVPSPPPPPPPPPPSSSPTSPPSSQRVEVAELRLAANREFVGVRFRMIGGDRFDPEATEIYLVDESTGKSSPSFAWNASAGLRSSASPGKRTSITSCSGTGRGS